MKRCLLVALSFGTSGMLVAQDPVSALRDLMPPDLAEQVIATVDQARAVGLPGDAVALRALEGLAKGRKGEEIAAAARLFSASLAEARRALENGGRAPQAAETIAAAAAMDLGLDGEAISTLAASAPAGRSLAVPLAVLGALVDRGLPPDQAVLTVLQQLQAQSGDVRLAALPAQASRMLAEGIPIGDIGRALGATGGAPALPPNVGGLGVPVPIPAGIPQNPGTPSDRPGPPVSPPRKPPVGRPDS